ncbi:hypothetical protein OHS18_15285 [Amycolatopsis sp. NBC_00355]|uniref:hypothetical protein n=1 Tax=Amycolatopsis sp. NBC_00355 TaxID=2975957 RepID=UPI002E271D10
MVLRVLSVVLLVALTAIGAAAVLAGVAEQHAADNAYVADFARPGAECGSGEVHFDESDGVVLACLPRGGSSVRFPGFSDAQNDDVEALAKNLGADSLSTVDRARIQQRVDEIAATVPEPARPHYDEGMSLGPVWGAGLAWAGGAVALLGGLGLYLRRRRG